MIDETLSNNSVFDAGKRLGLSWCPEMGDWFVGYSPRNCNYHDEGTWAHWCNLAAFILSHPATQVVDPKNYRPDLVADPQMYTGGGSLTDEQAAQFFAKKDPTNA